MRCTIVFLLLVAVIVLSEARSLRSNKLLLKSRVLTKARLLSRLAQPPKDSGTHQDRPKPEGDGKGVPPAVRETIKFAASCVLGYVEKEAREDKESLEAPGDTDTTEEGGEQGEGPEGDEPDAEDLSEACYEAIEISNEYLTTDNEEWKRTIENWLRIIIGDIKCMEESSLVFRLTKQIEKLKVDEDELFKAGALDELSDEDLKAEWEQLDRELTVLEFVKDETETKIDTTLCKSLHEEREDLERVFEEMEAMENDAQNGPVDETTVGDGEGGTQQGADGRRRQLEINTLLRRLLAAYKRRK